MAEYLIPQINLNNLLAVAKKAPVPFESWEASYLLLMQAQPYQRPVEKRARQGRSASRSEPGVTRSSGKPRKPPASLQVEERNAAASAKSAASANPA